MSGVTFAAEVTGDDPLTAASLDAALKELYHAQVPADAHLKVEQFAPTNGHRWKIRAFWTPDPARPEELPERVQRVARDHVKLEVNPGGGLTEDQVRKLAEGRLRHPDLR